MNTQEKIIIIGAGLSGPLLAILLAKKGYKVEIYESRTDMRTANISAGRSINLALSARGIRALRSAGMDEIVMKEALPMEGRIIHDKTGNTKFMAYSGRAGEHINSISRGGLNIILMNEAEKLGIKIHFNMKCTHADFENNSVVFKNYETGKISTETATAIIGTDGANSAIRQTMFENGRALRFSFSQAYLQHGYKELHIPPGKNGSFLIEKNGLHIWPRGEYMLIALPNFDGSFTVTLFHPFNGENGFDALTTPEKIQAFFEEEFPDVIDIIPNLLHDFQTNPTGSLATIKCYPWQVNGRFCLVGDSSHAVVPFYGQGMNASFEDCRILSEMVDEFKGDWSKIFTKYQSSRKKDADAIGDLAEENFYEMRDHVADPVFAKKRVLETRLEANYPDYYSKYAMVTFKDKLPYSVAKSLGTKQDEFLMDFCRDLTDLDAVDLDGLFRELQEI